MRGDVLPLLRGIAFPLLLCTAPWAATNTCVDIGPLKHWGTMIPLTLSDALPLLLGGTRPFWLFGLLRLVLLVKEVDDGGSASPDWHAWNDILQYGQFVAA
jgi:hypothetical protein